MPTPTNHWLDGSPLVARARTHGRPARGDETIQDGWAEDEYRKALTCDPKLLDAMILLGELLFYRALERQGA